MTAEAVAAWQDVLASAKILQPLAGYRTGTDPARTCATCGYHDGGECQIVAGATGDTRTCNLWKRSHVES